MVAHLADEGSDKTEMITIRWASRFVLKEIKMQELLRFG